MGLETGTLISDLIATNPTNNDQKAQGAAHLRLLKSSLKATFPNVTGVVTATHTELSVLSGVTSPIQSQLAAEITARTNADNAEITARANADTDEVTARTNADALKANIASPALTGVPTAPTASAGTSTTQIATTAYVAAQAFVSALPSQSGNAGKFVTTDGANASWTAGVNSINGASGAVTTKTLNGITLTGTGNILTQAPPVVRKAFLIATTTHTIPAGVASVRVYAFGAGAAANGNIASGAGGGCAYGDIAVTPGDVLTVNISAGVSALIFAGVQVLTGNAASGVTAGTAAKNISVTNGGANSGGAGVSAASSGGASSGWSGGAGVASSGGTGGGSGWGGPGITNVSGGGVGLNGGGLSVPGTDPLIIGLEGGAMPASTQGGGLPGLPGGGGGTALSNGSTGGTGGFGGGGGASVTSAGGTGGFGGGGGFGGTGGAGGFGGGGGCGSTSAGAGGGAAVLIFY